MATSYNALIVWLLVTISFFSNENPENLILKKIEINRTLLLCSIVGVHSFVSIIYTLLQSVPWITDFSHNYTSPNCGRGRHFLRWPLLKQEKRLLCLEHFFLLVSGVLFSESSSWPSLTSILATSLRVISACLFLDLQTLIIRSSPTVTKVSWSRGWNATAFNPLPCGPWLLWIMLDGSFTP